MRYLHVESFFSKIWFSGRKLGQYADQELLKLALFQNKTPDLSLKYILIQVNDQQE